MARIAALYRAGSSTEKPPRPQSTLTVQDQQRARQWQAELAASVARLERHTRAMRQFRQAGPGTDSPTPGFLIVGARERAAHQAATARTIQEAQPTWPR